MTREKVISLLTRFRTTLLLATACVMFALILGRFIPGIQHDWALLILVSFGVLLVSVFLVQLAIVLLVGSPKPDTNSRTKAVSVKSNPRSTQTYSDWLGSNANKRFLLIVGLLLALYWILHAAGRIRSDNIFYLLPIALAFYWQMFFRISKITFDSQDIRLESAAYATWALGRHVSIPYTDLRVEMPKSAAGHIVSFYRGDSFVWRIGSQAWTDSFVDIIEEVRARLPGDRFQEFVLYRN